MQSARKLVNQLKKTDADPDTDCIKNSQLSRLIGISLLFLFFIFSYFRIEIV